MKLSGPSVWAAPLQPVLSGVSPQAPSAANTPLSLAQHGLFCSLCAHCWATQAPSPHFPTCCFPQNSQPWGSSRAAAPAQAATAVHIVIIYAHDPQLPTVGPHRFACESHFSAPNFKSTQEKVECSRKSTS